MITNSKVFKSYTENNDKNKKVTKQNTKTNIKTDIKPNIKTDIKTDIKPNKIKKPIKIINIEIDKDTDDSDSSDSDSDNDSNNDSDSETKNIKTNKIVIDSNQFEDDNDVNDVNDVNDSDSNANSDSDSDTDNIINLKNKRKRDSDSQDDIDSNSEDSDCENDVRNVSKKSEKIDIKSKPIEIQAKKNKTSGSKRNGSKTSSSKTSGSKTSGNKTSNGEKYLDIREIYKLLEKQKQEKCADVKPIIDGFAHIVKPKPSPVNTNHFLINQFTYNDSRNPIHKDLEARIVKMVHPNGFIDNNIILHGSAGAGKYTLGMKILHHVYGDSIWDRLNMSKTIDNTKIDFIQNKYYYEILINDYVFNDNAKLVTFIKNSYKRNDGLCQYFVIKHFDELTDVCQRNVLYVMNKYRGIRFIFTVRHLENIIDNIKSCCNLVRVPRPDAKELAKYLNKLAKNNNLKITHTQIEYIVRTSECNINQAINALEIACINSENTYTKVKDSHRNYIAELLQVATGPSIENIKEVRQLISKLIITTYDVSDVYRTCVKLFLNSKYDIPVKNKVIEIASEYSQLSHIAHNTIFVLECFFLQIMEVINNEPVKKNYSLQKITKNK
jgi:DNA polymerase III delta prime subunit